MLTDNQKEQIKKAREMAYSALAIIANVEREGDGDPITERIEELDEELYTVVVGLDNVLRDFANE